MVLFVGGMQIPVGEIITMDVEGGKLIALQVEPKAIMRMALYKTEPELGEEIVGLIPSILKNEDVRKELMIPKFDEAIVRPKSHRRIEADIELLHKGKKVAELSVKFSSRGNIYNNIVAWRREVRPLDLLLIFIIRTWQDKKSEYHAVLAYIPKEFKIYSPKNVENYVFKLLSKKAKVCGFTHYRIIDSREVATALRDYILLKNQEKMLRNQEAMLNNQERMLRNQEKMINNQETMIRNQEKMLQYLEKIATLLEKLLEKIEPQNRKSINHNKQ